MKKSILGILLLLLDSGFLLAETPSTISLQMDQIFSVETGLDTNDSIEIAVLGHLSNTCQKLGKGRAYVKKDEKVIFVNVEGYVKKSKFCLEIVTPFLEVIQVGFLPKGTYQIKSLQGMTGKLQIKEASSRQTDEYLYAPVDTVDLNAQTVNFNEDEAQILNIKGTYPFLLKGCMRVVNLKSYKTNNNVLVVQPIAKIFDEDHCNPEDVDQYNRFNISKVISTPIEGRGMLHIRTLNGRAINKFIDLFNQ